MQHIAFQTLFKDSFNTFKVFDNLTIAETGPNRQNTPKTIWQILNHLIIWQDYQLNQLENGQSEDEVNEQATWIEEEQSKSQEELNTAIATFNRQLQRIEKLIEGFDLKDPEIQRKLKIVQDLSVHLSFHVGEVILMRRIAGNYPLPHQMKDFLK
jgi:uncharacterized damage-inducible protein DinB